MTSKTQENKDPWGATVAQWAVLVWDRLITHGSLEFFMLKKRRPMIIPEDCPEDIPE